MAGDSAPDTHTPLIIGLLGAVGVIGLTVLPAVVAEGPGTDQLTLYYSFGIGGLWIVAIIATALVIVFLASLTGRTDATLAASAANGGGFIMMLAAVSWFLDVDDAIHTQLTTADWFAYHPELVVIASAIVPLCGLWLAYRLGYL